MKHLAWSLPLILLFAPLAAGDGSLGPLVNPLVAGDDSAETITIYTAKTILTMEPTNPRATAVAVRGKRILAVGSLEEVQAALGDLESTVDERFADKVMIAGLIEQHLHPILGALTLAVEVIAPEDWVLPRVTWAKASNAEEYMTRLKAAVAKVQDPDEIFFTWGYHQYFHGSLDRKVLDAVSGTRPIAVWHRSCHEFYLNTPALERFGITAESLAGHGQASEQASFEKGHFYEKGLELVVGPVLEAMATKERLLFGLEQMIEYLHQGGVTNICEPGAIVTPKLFKLYQQVLGADDVPFNSYFIADGRTAYDKYREEGALREVEKSIAAAPEGKVSFFAGQVKLFADGAIISQLMQMKDGYLDGHEGQWIASPEDIAAACKLFWDAGYQIHTHVNGDLGLEVLLDSLERCMRENPRYDHRCVIVHFANSTEEQVARIARLGAIVSANPYYVTGFSDKYGEVGLGPERADAMVRSGSVVKRGIPYSFHSDLPMAPSIPLFLAWCGANRITPSGRVAGPEQRIAVEDALKAVTSEAAWSWRRENEIGSIAPGKLANFTILEQDPLAVDPLKLKDVPVWGTVFEGRIFPIPQDVKERAALRRAAGGGKTDLASLPLPACLCPGVDHEHAHAYGHHGECGACAFNRLLARVGGVDSLIAWSQDD